MSNLGAQDATVGGQADRISAADKMAAALSRMQAEGGTVTAEIEIKRAGSGAVERHTLVFTPIKEAE